MRRAIALIGMVGMIGGGLSLAIVPSEGTQAQSTPKGERAFLISSADGYGVADCISSKAECGAIVADAYCESQGYRKAASFGVASKDDLTGSTEAAVAPGETLVITCRG